MIDLLLACIPGWFTGLTGPRAKREVSGWTKNNATLRTLKYGSFRRLLLWGADHPFIFALLIGAISACIAYIISGQYLGFEPKLKSPNLDEKFDLAGYIGVLWTVQATLVALVYPIVVSFIALMLQRKAHSTAALRIYVLDSAVIPAGASSIGLLLALGAQYFAAPYSTPYFLAKYMAPLLLLNGTWFACNLFLTGFFLSRTVRFTQEEEQQYAYTRIAVDVVLRAELTSAVKQHIFVQAPYTDWDFTTESEHSDNKPQVRTLSLSRGKPAAQRNLKGNMILHDIHLHLLKLVVRSWCKRAELQHQSSKHKIPVISFPPMVGEVATGEVVLCSVENGPSLTLFERALVSAAFWYRPSRLGKMSLSTKKLLEEIGSEVEAAAEQHRFGAAEDGLRNMLRLHKTLLLASAADSKGVAESAATIGTSPYAWGETSFDIEWLKPYREIGRIAVAHLDEDSRLFRALAHVPTSIAQELSPKPEKLVIDAMHIGMNLAFQLGGWWTRKADASLLPGATSFSGSLQTPLSKVYEQALISFVGSWGQLHIWVPESETADPDEAWAALTARALVYAKHIDNSAEIFLKAVSRGDEVASSWLLDNFIKWWGNRQHELEYGELDEFQVRHVTMSLADKSWLEAKRFLKCTETPITVDTAGKALSLAIRRYWESMRLYVLLLLIHNAGPTAMADCRELRLAAALIKGEAQKRGGNTDCWPLDNVDAIITALLGEVFGVETVVSRIDQFAEKLRWDNEAPEVSGWIYGWSGNPTNLGSMKREQAILLVVLALPRSRRNLKDNKLIGRWWKDLDKLESVARYCQNMRQEVLIHDFSLASPAITALCAHIGTVGRLRSAQFAVACTMKALHKEALHERITTLRAMDVDEQLVRRLAEKISDHAFDQQHWWSLPTIAFVAGLVDVEQSMLFEDNKKRFTAGVSQQPDNGFAENIAQYVRQHVLGWAFSKLVSETGLLPANTPSLRNNYDATISEIQGFISSVGALCTSLHLAGDDPVVLVGRSALRSNLRPDRWGPGSWQRPFPAGVTLRDGNPNMGEHAKTFINETPMYEFETPNGDCYIVPSALVKTLEVAGSGTSSALSIRWTQLNDERLRFEVNWKARFR